jgi:hypothetical protein
MKINLHMSCSSFWRTIGGCSCSDHRQGAESEHGEYDERERNDDESASRPRRIRHARAITAVIEITKAPMKLNALAGRGRSNNLRPASNGSSPGAQGRSCHAAELQWEHDTNKSV